MFDNPRADEVLDSMSFGGVVSEKLMSFMYSQFYRIDQNKSKPEYINWDENGGKKLREENMKIYNETMDHLKKYCIFSNDYLSFISSGMLAAISYDNYTKNLK